MNILWIYGYFMDIWIYGYMDICARVFMDIGNFTYVIKAIFYGLYFQGLYMAWMWSTRWMRWIIKWIRIAIRPAPLCVIDI